MLREDGIGSVVFAHKTTEGWEALLGGLIHGGWTITGSWPISTEMATRLRARDSAALATSVHLVCRPRPEDTPVGDWGQGLRELPKRVADWMNRLQEEGVRGADLVFACIGPALEIYSRYSKVETAEAKEIKLDEYLQKAWEVVGRTALEQVLGTAEARSRNGAAGVLEEDARLTALFLWTLQSTAGITNGDDQASEGDDEEADEEEDEEEAPRKKTKGFTLIYDVVRRFAQPLGIRLPDWERRIIEVKKGVVRLLPVSERAPQLFGEEGATAVADRIESHSRRPEHVQLTLFPDEPPVVKPRKGGRKKSGADVPDKSLQTRREATTLDRVHAAMLLQSSGRANALRTLLKTEQDRGPDFSGWPTPCRPFTRPTARRNAFSTLCCLPCRNERTMRKVWHISGGSVARSYAEVFFRYGVGLIRPGDAGPWRAERADDEFGGSHVRRFASEVEQDDVFLIRFGTSWIQAVGVVASDYLYLNQFDEVNGLEATGRAKTRSSFIWSCRSFVPWAGARNRSP
jgi:hypothetical protein